MNMHELNKNTAQEILFRVGGGDEVTVNQKDAVQKRRRGAGIVGGIATGLALTGVLANGAANLGEDAPTGSYSVTVEQGDTLWDEARQVYGDQVDIRDKIHDMDASLQPGQVITFRDVPLSRIDELNRQQELADD